MKLLLFRALNRNQILLLQNIASNSTETITALIRRLVKVYNISESTLKANSRILRNLDLIQFGGNSVAKLTNFGRDIVRVLGDDGYA